MVRLWAGNAAPVRAEDDFEYYMISSEETLNVNKTIFYKRSLLFTACNMIEYVERAKTLKNWILDREATALHQFFLSYIALDSASRLRLPLPQPLNSIWEPLSKKSGNIFSERVIDVVRIKNYYDVLQKRFASGYLY
jgi:hypothetical protein